MNEFAVPETQPTIDPLPLGNRGTLSAQPKTNLGESGVCTPDILTGSEEFGLGFFGKEPKHFPQMDTRHLRRSASGGV